MSLTTLSSFAKMITFKLNKVNIFIIILFSSRSSIISRLYFYTSITKYVDITSQLIFFELVFLIYIVSTGYGYWYKR